MLERWMPHASYGADPIFRYGVRRLRWGRSPAALNRASLILGAIVLLTTFALGAWAIASDYEAASCNTLPISACYYPARHASRDFTAVLLLVAIGVDGFLDFACIRAAFHTMRTRGSEPQRDLLSLTHIPVETVVGAENAVAQVHVWTMMVFVTALRVAVIVLYLVRALVLPLLLGGSIGDYVTLGYLFNFNWLFLIVGAAVGAFVLIAEPLWRTRAMTALGIALAARFREPVSASLAGLGATLATWIVQIMLLSVLLLGTALFTETTNMLYCVPVFGVVLGALGIRGLFWGLERAGIGAAERTLTPS